MAGVDNNGDNLNQKKSNKTVRIIIGVVVALFVIGLLSSVFSSDSEDLQDSSSQNNTSNTSSSESSSSNSQTNTDSSTSNSSSSNNSTYTLGDTIEFDGLQIAFSTSYSFVTISNQYSDYNGSSVIKLPVTITNVSDEKTHLNMFYFDLFGSKGTQLSTVSAYFDESVDYAGDLKPNASYNKYFYILYDGDGTYSIDFDNYSEEVSVEFEITKS